MRGDEQNAPLQQSPAKLVAVVTPVRDHSPRSFLRSAWSAAGHRDFRQRAFGQRHFPRTGRDPLASQRNPLAVDPHHPLRTFAPLGFSDALAPFLAGAKLPSRNDSRQSSLLPWSNSERNCRQILSQTPRSSHWRQRRQHVLGLGYSGGSSLQRAPVLRTQRMPSRTRRLSAQGRPRLRTLGKCGSIVSHCGSDKNAFCLPSFSPIRRKSTSAKYLQFHPYETASSQFDTLVTGETPAEAQNILFCYSSRCERLLLGISAGEGTVAA
jgi:hypothetical protein